MSQSALFVCDSIASLAQAFELAGEYDDCVDAPQEKLTLAFPSEEEGLLPDRRKLAFERMAILWDGQ